ARGRTSADDPEHQGEDRGHDHDEGYEQDQVALLDLARLHRVEPHAARPYLTRSDSGWIREPVVLPELPLGQPVDVLADGRGVGHGPQSARTYLTRHLRPHRGLVVMFSRGRP